VTVAFVFPGQGAQYVGMAAQLAAAYPEAAAVLQEADTALGFALSEIIARGPDHQLRLTYYTQPAILAASLACLRAFTSRCEVKPDFVAGHSLGEYSALVAAGALTFADAVRLVHTRGKLMDEAVPAGRGTMAAVLGADEVLLKALCKAISDELHEPVELANVNCPGQIVVSGAVAAVDRLITRAAEAKARRAMRLDVSGPFHCSLMRPAGERLAAQLDEVTLHAPSFPVVANVTGVALHHVNEIRQALARQVASPVLWEATIVHLMEAGVDTFIEFGPGTVLSGLIKKTDKTAQILHVEDQDSLSQTLAALAAKGVVGA